MFRGPIHGATRVVYSTVAERKSLAHPEWRDVWIWERNDMGCYTVRDAYLWLQNPNQPSMATIDWRWVWQLKVPEKMSFFHMVGVA